MSYARETEELCLGFFCYCLMKEGSILFNDALNTFYLRLYGRERNVLFNDALNTFHLRLYGVRHMVKDHCDSEKGNPLPPHSSVRFTV